MLRILKSAKICWYHWYLWHCHPLQDDDDDHCYFDRQEKISISAGGALAFDTVNLLINTFSSLVRWPIRTMRTMTIMTMISATSFNFQQPWRRCQNLVTVTEWFFFTRCSGKRVGCSKRGREKEVASQPGVTFTCSCVRICQPKVRRLERGGQTKHLGAWPTDPPGHLSSYICQRIKEEDIMYVVKYGSWQIEALGPNLPWTVTYWMSHTWFKNAKI